MPVKRLTMSQRDKIFDIVDYATSMEDDSDYSGMPEALNHVFAKIYGYKKRSRSAGHDPVRGGFDFSRIGGSKKKKKPNSWNKFVKANSKKKIYQFANGKLKLKKMGIAYRKTRAYRSKK